MDHKAEMAWHDQQDRHGSTQFVIIADDLTGACDAAVPFSLRGIETFVFPSARAEGRHPSVLAVSTGSREVPLPEMEQSLTRALESIGREPQILKKIDSVFRGNTFLEIALAARMMADAVVVIAPAFPDLNRFCRGGIQQVQDVVADLPIPVYDELRRAGIDCVILPVYRSREELGFAVAEQLEAGHRFFLFDSELHSDLDSIVAVMGSLDRKVLWVGSGGLAQSLAEAMPQRVRSSASDLVKGRVLFCIGSNHLATQRQLQDLKTHHDTLEHSFSETGTVSDESLIVCRVPRDSGKTAICELIATTGTSIGCIFLTGGDTAAQFCEAMDVDCIEIRDQFAPGVPIGIFHGGPLAGNTVILKSGGFGETDLLTRIAERYAAIERRAVGF